MKQSGICKKGELSLDDILRSLRDIPNFGEVGAVGIFIGVVRRKSLDGQEVTKLEVDAYEEKANQSLSRISSDLSKKKGIIDVRIFHNLGEFEPSEDLVYAVVSGAHRNEVFEVLEEAVERYKHESPLFKKEHLMDKTTGKATERWVEENALE
ncbi:MAG: molybdenum cofactor biosynthesis protein MoaE [Candidatus Atabeyarchaeum deiterrae]